ncbi:eukaryotic translation initiation factor 2A [Impatiens glandulifera]|uniref:eukaryotic translation initiation factor 2A n=1 Tax=Impatiens glandulifera TaxID=253017 RepID=UPI001FB171D2|nr:eukaryotic translation initiation factor 2A [Impatiens glandulifera]
MTATGPGPSPSLEILVRTPDEFSLWNRLPFSNNQPNVKTEKVPCSSTMFSEDGSKLLVVKPDSRISIQDCKTLKEIKSFEVPNLLGYTLSPCGTYLQTFQKASTPQEKNVTLWKVENGVSVYQHFQKNMNKTTWPVIRFCSDESVACRMATNEVQFFDGADFSKGIVHRLRVPGVAAVELSKSPGSHVAVYVPESKGVPASVQIFPSGNSGSQPVARRSFFRCSSIQLIWNTGSTGLLVVVQSDVDKTNQNYYGETKLNYLTTDGAHEGIVPLRKEGPVHDVQWSNSGNEFAVVYGSLPDAAATLFDKKCKPLLELGTGPYNTIRMNPKGKFLCLAGFGNLPGYMAFWDYEEKKKLLDTKAELSVTSEWSPDGLYFMTATTAPRLQVDNGIKIFHHNGSLFFKKMFDKLYQVEWKPESPDRFGEIAELVKSFESLKTEETKSQGGQASKGGSSIKKAVAATTTTVQKPAAYRPPHAKLLDAVQSELFGVGPSQEMSKTALRNKKKREKQKEKKAAEGSAP